ncbi:choline kinase family protein [Neobacillus sp. DY30]|uniref:choline kinase family protein n=1 Tax=Neobacillus sp. DY30 TaxID=3047871 RepID=UPI0024BF38B0|nr:choline kinase family protein [Neobacillus sp. DY30]WHY02502.1 phosphotransferase [Neobacillus sp. DY30]
MNIEDLVQSKLRSIFDDDYLIFDKSRFAGGLTNYNYIMNIKGSEYIIRQPGGMTNQMIDRSIEKVNNRIASELGLNSECVYFDENSGIKISAYIKNSQNVALANPCKNGNLRAVSSLLKKTHLSKRHFPNVFDWKTELTKYEQIVKELNGDFFYDYHALKRNLLNFLGQNIIQTISQPCHNDPVPENFVINDKDEAYLIDWEYSGMNDPAWDVAAYILESKLDDESIKDFLTDYYDHYPKREEIAKIKGFMLAQDLLWTVWALIRHYNGDDFLDYCYFRYERFRKNMVAISHLSDYSISSIVKN